MSSVQIIACYTGKYCKSLTIVHFFATIPQKIQIYNLQAAIGLCYLDKFSEE